VVIDIDDLIEARRESQIMALLNEAEADGARAAQEGRRRW
jgi:hypothetical protein